jgi:hypothetical protein
MRRLCTLAAVALAAFLPLEAGAVKITWTNPTQNTDGTAIPATGAGSLTKNTIEQGSCGTNGAFGVLQTTYTVQPAAQTYTIDNATLTAGCYAYRISATNTANMTSGYSAVKQITIAPAPVPNPPVISTVTLVWDVNEKTPEVKLGRVVGEIDVGEPCVPGVYLTNKGTDYFQFSSDQVNRWTHKPRSLVLVTQCAES